MTSLLQNVWPQLQEFKCLWGNLNNSGLESSGLIYSHSESPGSAGTADQSPSM